MFTCIRLLCRPAVCEHRRIVGNFLQCTERKEQRMRGKLESLYSAAKAPDGERREGREGRRERRGERGERRGESQQTANRQITHHLSSSSLSPCIGSPFLALHFPVFQQLRLLLFILFFASFFNI
jgi:hypothetical protein